MDEFFRQTIAQIKEELTKKLENNNEEDEDIGDFSDEDDDDDYDENEDEDEFDEDDIENQRFASTAADEGELAAAARARTAAQHSFRNNRNQIYQQLLAPPPKTAAGESAVSGTWRQAATKWLVLFGCVLNMSIVEGLCYNYVNIQSLVTAKFVTVKASRSHRLAGWPEPLMAVLPTACLVGLFLLMTPLSVFMAKTQGSRTVSVFGSVLSAMSLLVCSFQENIYGFILTYGIITGK